MSSTSLVRGLGLTAAISIVLVAMAYDEVWSSLLYLHRVWKRSHDRRLLWETFWGRPSAVWGSQGLNPSSAFGRIRSTSQLRQIQFALKYSF